MNDKSETVNWDELIATDPVLKDLNPSVKTSGRMIFRKDSKIPDPNGLTICFLDIEPETLETGDSINQTLDLFTGMHSA